MILLYTDFTIVFRVFWFHQLSLTWQFFVKYYLFVLLYCEFMDWETFFYSQAFFTYTLAKHLAQPAFMKASPRPAIQPWRLQGFPVAGSSAWKAAGPRFETQIWSICLFESHSVQPKILVGRFYSCIKGWSTPDYYTNHSRWSWIYSTSNNSNSLRRIFYPLGQFWS